VLDDAGAPRSFRATGHDYLKAPVDERLDDNAGTLAWQSIAERGQAPARAGWFIPRSEACRHPTASVRGSARRTMRSCGS
jgi:hypothetical protein